MGNKYYFINELDLDIWENSVKFAEKEESYG